MEKTLKLYIIENYHNDIENKMKIIKSFSEIEKSNRKKL